MNDWREQWRETNRAHWDERVPIHVSGEFYGVTGFKAGQERLRPFEISEVGEVSGKDLLHLQCHFGIDTLSWARRGARVVGLDFSLPAIVEARKLAAELALEAEFVHSDVYDGNVMSTRVSSGQLLDLRAFLFGLVVVLHMSVMDAHLRGSYRLARWSGVGMTGLVTAAALTIALLRWAWGMPTYPKIRHESGRSGDQFVLDNRSS